MRQHLNAFALELYEYEFPVRALNFSLPMTQYLLHAYEYAPLFFNDSSYLGLGLVIWGLDLFVIGGSRGKSLDDVLHLSIR